MSCVSYKFGSTSWRLPGRNFSTVMEIFIVEGRSLTELPYLIERQLSRSFLRDFQNSSSKLHLMLTSSIQVREVTNFSHISLREGFGSMSAMLHFHIVNFAMVTIAESLSLLSPLSSPKL